MTRAIEGSEQFYSPDSEQLQFFRDATGIADEAELKKHIINVQQEGYKVHAYPCIYNFSFIKLTLARLSAYSRVLEFGKLRKNAIFLDVGCCFGNDVRKAIMDGFPMERVICTDLLPDFWMLGHKLFRTTPETYPVAFLAGDILDPDFLKPADPFYVAPPSEQEPEVSAIGSLSPLHGHVAVISICNVFHLFDTEEAQTRLARALASLLSPQPGSMIIGTHAARPEHGSRLEKVEKDHLHHVTVYYHSPESWKALCNGEIFRRGTVKVEARLIEHEVNNSIMGEVKYWFMDWSVTRL
ncbi:hypothetical protein L226DRAFT_471237 [Lentinus tigrinus ALCF2SS1-7]|uniref:Methyltransferase domain-containing protein n=1 Tax=Lentinus tigrinus ALCF2SS1-6 TaxID=1328759 RepID=A0A5C2S6Z3_9APHY|nr:hypothetical protein L227DRAFT_504596 [Lentinus tigrinus ALCF2SS1-6]RPD69877.1 hypothetical protein L226DRAFT_471237 [Lentinus tigrinus ALCF2SS1-7]